MVVAVGLLVSYWYGMGDFLRVDGQTPCSTIRNFSCSDALLFVLFQFVMLASIALIIYWSYQAINLSLIISGGGNSTNTSTSTIGLSSSGSAISFWGPAFFDAVDANIPVTFGATNVIDDTGFSGDLDYGDGLDGGGGMQDLGGRWNGRSGSGSRSFAGEIGARTGDDIIGMTAGMHRTYVFGWMVFWIGFVSFVYQVFFVAKHLSCSNFCAKIGKWVLCR
jgi:hypothetical protein